MRRFGAMAVMTGLLCGTLRAVDLPDVWDARYVKGLYSVQISTKNLKDAQGMLEVLTKLRAHRRCELSFPKVIPEEFAVEISFSKVDGVALSDEDVGDDIKRAADQVTPVTGVDTVTGKKGSSLRISLKKLKGAKEMLALLEKLAKTETVQVEFPGASVKGQYLTLMIRVKLGKKKPAVEKEMTTLIDALEAISGKDSVGVTGVPRMPRAEDGR